LNGDKYFSQYVCGFKNLNFLCIAKIKSLLLNEAEGILVKIPEIIW